MTNLEWLKTLSAEELADWFYDEWLHHLQYRWSSSRGGLIIWLKDCKDEPTGYNLSPVDKDINVRSKDEPKLSEIPNNCEDEPQSGYCNECKWYGDKQVCGRCRSRNLYAPKTEPQPSKIIEAYAKGYKDGADAVNAMPQTERSSE